MPIRIWWTKSFDRPINQDKVDMARLVLLITVLIAQLLTSHAVPLRRESDAEGSSVRNWRSALIRDRESLPDYQPLCQSVTHRVDLIEPGYEFRPPFYHSVECKHTADKHHHSGHHHKSSHETQICLQSGLSCVQRSRTIQIAKRKIGTTCWTLLTKEVHSGCDCMWPVQSHGDSKHHLPS